MNLSASLHLKIAAGQLRVGELKSMLHLALGELEQALDWANWTLNMNSSVFTTEPVNYYRALISIIELHLDQNREPAQYRAVFEKMYGKDAVKQAWAAVSEGGNPFYNLPASDENLENFKEHQALLGLMGSCRKQSEHIKNKLGLFRTFNS